LAISRSTALRPFENAEARLTRDLTFGAGR
jgi:hypothetical protein